ncbi:MAG: putative porin [Bacteroides sp.]|nr:putative porin [Bacteroides sp.]
MKILRFLLLHASLLAAGLSAPGQQPLHSDNPVSNQQTDAEPQKIYRPSAWTLTTPLGFHIPAGMDTLPYNYQTRNVPSMVSDAYASTSNLGGEGINLLYFQRPQRRDFFFADALAPWIPNVKEQKFYNVYVPMTLLSYNFAGSSDTHQDHLNGQFAGNVNRRIGVGAFIDYIHSKGAYANLAVKNFNFGANIYYTGDRYEMQALYQQYNSLNRENGGITDQDYIRDPAKLQGGVTKIESQSIPTNLSNAFSRLTGARFFTTQAYKLGFWREVQVNDTLTRDEFVAHTKFIYSFEYRHDRHAFRDFSSSDITSFWKDVYLNPSLTSDVTTLNTIVNTLGVSMVEGFQKWAKFALGAYASIEHRSYTLPNGQKDVAIAEPGTEGLTPIPEGTTTPAADKQTILWIGGRIEKTRGSILKYNADARFGVTGDYAGDLDVNGEVATNIPLMADTLSIRAEGFFRNHTPSWLLQHYVSNNFIWDNSFSRTRSFRVRGIVDFPKSGTTLSAGFENTRNLIYFDDQALPAQCGSPVSVFSASLEQRLKLGILHWDNRITYQECSDQRVLPMPRLSVYSNLYLQFTAFRVLHLQIGADCDYYTQYCGLAYQPATMTFHTQQTQNLGDYPLCNVYINAKLYRTRFYVMMSHINQGWFSTNYFSLPGYPVNPRRLQIGLCIDFAN